MLQTVTIHTFFSTNPQLGQGPVGAVILFSIVLTGAVPLGARGLTSRFLAHIAGKLVVAVANKLSQA